MVNMFNRRSFLKTGLAVLPIASIADLSSVASAEPGSALLGVSAMPAAADTGDKPWQQTVHRVGQLNMTEHDPVEMNIEEWATIGRA
jgi:hypothetical protein